MLGSLLIPVYFFLFFAIGFIAIELLEQNSRQKKYIYAALFAKLLAALAYCLIYRFYYTSGGDTAVYYSNGQLIYNLFL